ncbi:2-amino-4-hydroxy-6-hydroxymethyldihydropteridine diphosphokinase [Anaeromyxobacter oryzae]|uniref:2-amino-4-hydroxy-6-hydroxymethyldihydropteridine pyrophosphokinase n=1 Tax=Anaeromyxobacter oryzae TaxID=2918170 RepID=A0ABM7X052_9BACT|nr:2-amino-4-hydroxy-6-hydroxymethyldihydropteridine diphosphokinase [Anaeromyxobacter oryzae]BDG05086.1 2-amino-4-hydroxy-6-hydroxymethyldihydropteridine diphosphokinase [Anaeromyxobacter oryzae]
MTARVFIGIGSSVAPETNVANALQRLGDTVGVLALSTFFVTPALERPTHPPFVNGVAQVGDLATPSGLKTLLRDVEEAVGRRRGADRFAPREIDLDLLLYGDVVSSTADLPLPHPDVTARRFVALPLLELAPDLVLPGAGVPLASLAQALPPYPMKPLVQLTRELRRRYVVHGHRQG